MHALHQGQERLGFRFDGLGKQSAGAAPQNRRQRIVNRIGLSQANNGAFCCASLGIVPTVRHADYIASWLEVLREDNRAINGVGLWLPAMVH